MSYAYPINLTVASTFSYVNSVTFGYLSLFIYIAIFAVTFIALHSTKAAIEESLAAAALISFMPMAILWLLDFVPDLVLTAAAIILVIVIAFIVWVSKT